jgi:hypothetical protein
MIVNFAERAHSHNRELGSSHPILAGYGLLQAPDVAVHLEASPENPGSFALFNRTSSVRLADMSATRERKCVRTPMV